MHKVYIADRARILSPFVLSELLEKDIYLATPPIAGVRLILGIIRQSYSYESWQNLQSAMELLHAHHSLTLQDSKAMDLNLEQCMALLCV